MQRFAPDKLRAHRRECGLSRDAAAFACRRSVSMYVLYERGKFSPNGEVLEALAAAFDCRIEDFFEDVSNG